MERRALFIECRAVLMEGNYSIVCCGCARRVFLWLRCICIYDVGLV